VRGMLCRALRARLLLLVVVERLPETNPYVEQAQPTADAAEEAVGDDGSQAGKRKQQVVVGPLRSPRKNDQQNSCNRTDQDKEKDRDAMHPKLNAAWA